MKKFSTLKLHEVTKFHRILDKAGFTAEIVRRINQDPTLAETMFATLETLPDANPGVTETTSIEDKNPFEQSVEVQIAALRHANDEEGWGIPVEDIDRLEKIVPAWPKGRLAFRSFRIRFGEGDEGVANTFEAHMKRIKEVFRRFWRWEYLLSGKDCLRLLVGNHTHKPTVEWVVIDLDAHRKRDSITAVRGPQSLADELLVFTWMFSDYIRSIDYETNPGLFAGGYELNVSGHGGEQWRRVPYVDWNHDFPKVELDANWRTNDGSYCSVPVFLE